MAGKPYLMRVIGFGFRRPKNRVPGLDVAGTVVAVGSEVTRFEPGDEVFGMSRGSFAEYAAVREDKLAHKPASLSFEQAAVVPISAGTALQALRDSGNLEAGQKVLIIGASGGVGTYAVQLAKVFGAEVTGVSQHREDSTWFVPSVPTMSSTTPARTTSTVPTATTSSSTSAGTTACRGSVGPSLPRARSSSSVGKRVATCIGGFDRQLRALALSLFVGQRLTMLASKERHTDLEALTPLLENGQVTPVIDRTYPLAEVPAAMGHLEAGQARGKIAITI